jgi:hypothetical protein
VEKTSWIESKAFNALTEFKFCFQNLENSMSSRALTHIVNSGSNQSVIDHSNDLKMKFVEINPTFNIINDKFNSSISINPPRNNCQEIQM